MDYKFNLGKLEVTLPEELGGVQINMENISYEVKGLNVLESLQVMKALPQIVREIRDILEGADKAVDNPFDLSNIAFHNYVDEDGVDCDSGESFEEEETQGEPPASISFETKNGVIHFKVGNSYVFKHDTIPLYRGALKNVKVTYINYNGVELEFVDEGRSSFFNHETLKNATFVTYFDFENDESPVADFPPVILEGDENGGASFRHKVYNGWHTFAKGQRIVYSNAFRYGDHETIATVVEVKEKSISVEVISSDDAALKEGYVRTYPLEQLNCMVVNLMRVPTTGKVKIESTDPDDIMPNF